MKINIYLSFIGFLVKLLTNSENLIHNKLKTLVSKFLWADSSSLLENCHIYSKMRIWKSELLPIIIESFSTESVEETKLLMHYFSFYCSSEITADDFENIKSTGIIEKDINFNLNLAIVLLYQEHLLKLEISDDLSLFKQTLFENIKKTKYFHQHNCKVIIDNRSIILNYKESFTLDDNIYSPCFYFQDSKLKSNNESFKIPNHDISLYSNFNENDKHFMEYVYYIIYLLSKEYFMEGDIEILQEKAYDYQFNEHTALKKDEIVSKFIIEIINILETITTKYQFAYTCKTTGLLIDLALPDSNIGFLFLNQKDFCFDSHEKENKISPIRSLELKCLELYSDMKIIPINTDTWMKGQTKDEKTDFFTSFLANN